MPCRSILGAIRKIPGYARDTWQLPSTVKYPELYSYWLEVDVDYCNLRLFRDLMPSDLYLYWDVLERRYLERYRRFLRLEYETGGDGLVEIPYPGAITIDHTSIRPEDINISECLEQELYEWYSLVDTLFFKDCTDQEMELEYSWGLEVAKKVALYVPKDIYFEYRPLQQIGVRKGRGVVLGCDPEINELLHLYPEGVLPRF